jgi:LruC domain-containing protein
MRVKFLLITALSALSLYSCKKIGNDDENANIKKLTDVKIPEGFTWESSRDVTFKVTVTDTRFLGSAHVISIYGPDGKLISKGSASLGSSFETKAYLPNIITEVYIVKTAPDNSNTSQKVTLNESIVNVSLGAPTGAISSTKNSGKTLSTSPDCTTGCTQEVALSTNNQTVTISGGKTVCVSGSNKSLSVSFTTGGGTLRICGTNLTINDLADNKINDPMSIIITSTGSVTFDDKNNRATNFNQNNNTLKNYGTVVFEGGINLAGTLENYGSLTVNGEYSTETQTDPVTVHTNEGTMVINGLMDIGSNSIFNNNATIKTTDFRVFNHATFNNKCKLWVTNEYDHSTQMNNYGYIKVDSKTFINGSSELAQYPGAILSTKDIKINGTIKGYNASSLVKVSAETELTGAGLITGTISYCDATGIEKKNGTISDGAALDCNLYIPASGCSDGNGSAPTVDTDGDGIPDNLDDYPKDASKAFNNYYISSDSNAGATVAFEDMWPAKGDYDMNDVVVSYQLKVITNANNKVVQVNGTYNLYARGGIYQNGFGIEFPVSRSLVSNVTGGLLEEGQQKAVIILFSNMHSELFYMNTKQGEPLSPAKTYSISFDITDGPTLSTFGLSEYNPFIWNQAEGRGYEVHLPGKTPTTLANTSIFGSGFDASNPAAGKYYVTSDGYPWAISIPMKDFNYPIEGKDIITAYLRLPEWIASGGTNYTDWYSSTASGYRNTTNIFK